MNTKIYSSYKAFLQRENKSENGVSTEFADMNPNFAEMNASNEACWNCKNCFDCFECKNCFNCENCDYCENCYECSNCDNCDYCEN